MWLSFGIVGLTACALAALFATLRWGGSTPRWILTVTLLIAAALLLAFTLVRPGMTLDEPPAWYDRSPQREIILFVLMLAGMAARFVTRAIEERRARIKEAASAGKRGRVAIHFDGWELVYPMMVSVVTFGVLLAQIGSEHLTVANAVIGFQTGFFWQTILNRSEGNGGQ
jgi:hypothetical protein